jgi:hypothetical protein
MFGEMVVPRSLEAYEKSCNFEIGTTHDWPSSARNPTINGTLFTLNGP